MQKKEKKNELLIRGKISDSDILEIKKLLKNEPIDIGKVQTNVQGLEEYVQLVFQNFDLITFSRDFILSAALSSLLNQFRKVIQFLTKRGKATKTITITSEIKYSNSIFNLSLTANPQDLDVAITMVQENIEAITKGAKNNSTILVVLNDAKALEVKRL